MTGSGVLTTALSQPDRAMPASGHQRIPGLLRGPPENKL